MPDLHQRTAVRWLFEAFFKGQFPRNIMEAVQLFCGTKGKLDIIGLLNFQSPSSMESLGLPSQAQGDSDDESSEMDESDVDTDDNDVEMDESDVEMDESDVEIEEEA
jgi:hypothetical protein